MALRYLLRRFPVGSWEARLAAGAVHRPHYALCMYHAALQARELGFPAVTVVELGVAGGNGLVCLCDHAQTLRARLGIRIDVVGFDSAAGLPAVSDPRDAPYLWQAGLFSMDRSALEGRIAGRASLIVGDAAETTRSWDPRPEAPLGAVMFDLDLYTSTAHTLHLLEKEHVLPRVYCYFDDIESTPEGAMSEGIGERQAIREFNLDPRRLALNDHLSPAHIFDGLYPEPWHRKIYVYHRLGHPQYNRYIARRGESDEKPFRLKNA